MELMEQLIKKFKKEIKNIEKCDNYAKPEYEKLVGDLEKRQLQNLIDVIMEIKRQTVIGHSSKKSNEKHGCISLAEVILRHSFPIGKDENYMPKFRMKNPEVDYVMNEELTKVIRVIEVKNEI